jgi:hypothetical protein
MMTITKTLKVTAVMAVLTFATFFMASGFSFLTMGSYPISDAFAQGGQNTANQGLAQSNNAATSALCSSGVLTGAACNSSTNQGNANSGSNTAGQTAGGGTGTGASTQSKHFDAKLSGKNEVPPKDTKATGTATFNVIGPNSITYTVHVKDMQMVTAAHIHQGKAGVNGPVLVTLYNNPTPSAMTNGELAKGTITATNLEGPLAGKQIADLIDMINSGSTYANVHTTANPMGEIRGQIVEGKTGSGGTNTANQGISQSNTATTAAQCAAGTLTGQACNSSTNQGNANSGSNTAGQTAGGSGTGMGTTGGGTNTANQGISQSNTATTAAQCAAGTLMGPACNSSTNQGNANSGSNTAGQVAGGSGTK